MTVPSISVRQQKKGGGVAPEVTPGNGFQLRTSRLIVLIHGYNNDEDAALESYAAFLANNGLDQASLLGQVCGFLWPGDNVILSSLSYPIEIRPAKESAEALQRFFAASRAPGGWPLEVTLVCHSLGNRVGLEVVRDWIANGRGGRVSFPGGALMAAAVPLFMMEESGQLLAAAQAIGRTLVLHSTHDWVLHWAFPVGETVCGEGLFPRAVGRFGEPNSVWAQSDDMSGYGYGHSDYWGKEESARAVAEFFGAVVERELAVNRIAGRETLTAAELPDRQLNTHEIASRSPGDN